MKKFIAIILTFCLILCAFPLQAMAYPGDIWRPGNDGGKVVQKKLENGALALQNDYLRVTLQKTQYGSYLTTIPTAVVAQNEGKSPRTLQYPQCTFVTYEKGPGIESSHYVHTALQSMQFVDKTPNGNNPAIKAEYALTIWRHENNTTFPAAVTVYHELVKLQEGKKGEESWGVLTTVGQVRMKKKDFPQDLMTDHHFEWEYQLEGFTGMGHYDTASSQSGPAPKMSHTTVKAKDGAWNDPETIESVSTASTTITSRIDDLYTYTSPKGYTQAGEKQGIYLTEVYVDSYPWANPFVGLSDYYEKGITTYTGAQPIRVKLPQTVTVVPSDRFDRMWVECTNRIGIPSYDDDIEENGPADEAAAHYLWGFRDLVQEKDKIPSKPDVIDPSITAKRLAVFQTSSGVTVEYVADDAALTTLKKRYNNAEPIALISGDYTSENGEKFEFTGNAAMLSPSVTATWAKGGHLVIHKDGTIEQKGVHLSAPTFKFYQPNSGSGEPLTMTLDANGFTFGIDPQNNDAIIAVDIPYATTKLEKATADVKGNLVFSGDIGFKTIFNGAEFTLEKLGYGLQEKTVGGKKTSEFKVNGVHATGSFNTADLLSLELASVEGEVNTFKGEERYAFELELNAFDLFETEASLALARSKKDGSLIPDELWFYVAASPGIPLVPPIPIGQLNGGGAGFKDLADTVNGNYFYIPPLKLRGALKGTYLHLVEGRGDVVLGPSEISLKASEVGLVGTNMNIVKNFGYSLKLEGQERTYKNETYKGIYFAGAEELELGLLYPNFEIINVKSSLELGAFGGVNDSKNKLYLGIGANGKAKGRLLIPKGFPFAGKSIGSADMELIIGGQTTTEIKGTSVSESMRKAFQNIDPYLGVMAQGEIPIFKARAWVLIPHIVKTNFRKGGGWDLEIKIFKQLSNWDWGEHGVTPVVRSAPQSLFMPLQTEAAIGEVIEQENAALQAIVLGSPEGKSSETITVNAGTEETPYILLDFGTDVTNVTEEMIQNSLTVNGETPTWTWGENETAKADKVYAASDLITKVGSYEQHRVVLLRLPSANASYNINAGTLTFTYEQKNVTPFEKLEMTQGGTNNETLNGQIKYAEPNVQYTLRTYLGAKQGEATYLVNEQEVTGSTSGVDTAITQFTVPTNGTHAPSGDYYVTTVLMTEKEATMENGQKVSALAAIDSWQFDKPVSYTNTNQPAAPTDVKLEATGNEVMQASWTAADKADGYAVKIYQQKTQKDGSKTWEDTGFGYDVDASKTSIDMAMTVGGNAVSVNENGTAAESVPAENLSADQTYKVGVRAYKTETLWEEPKKEKDTGSTGSTGSESGTGSASGATQTKKEVAKYYSPEVESSEKLLPKYTPLDFTLNVNGTDCQADEHGVFNAYVGGSSAAKKLTITCNDNNANFSVIRMDKEKDNTISPDANAANTFIIPEFTGSLMLCVEGVKDKDTTRKFLLVSTDDTPPVLTLSSAVFYADPDTGAYTITGTADAGSQILYGDENQEPVTAAGDGSFRVSGTIADSGTNSASITLAAKDSAGNVSAPQIALVNKQTIASETPSGGSYVPSAQQPTIQSGEGATVALNADGTAAKIVLQEGYELVDVTLNGVSQGKVTEIKGLKTGDKLVVITKKQETLEQQEQKRDKQVKKTFDALKLKARSKKLKNGNIRISFAGQFAEFEALAKQGYTIKYRFYRSTKKSSGYKRMFLSEQPIYINTYGKRGTMYYYKAIALAYNKDGKLIAKTELKQCRYAKRRWTK